MAQVQAAQLLARGVQDVWLSGDPQISFYRSTFKRHVPFAATIERFLVPIDGRILLNPKSDLLGYTYLSAHDPTTGALVPNADWSNIISTIELVIGNQTIATHDMTYINTIQKVLETDTYSKRSATSAFQPLGFFFDRQYLPIVGLNYSDVRVNITWTSTSTATQYVYKCWAFCVHLGEDERQFFATKRHQMLIPQLQRSIIQSEPTFHGPLKYIAAPCVNYSYVYSPPVPAGVSATGGTVTTYSSGGTTYTVHTFTATDDFTVTVGGLIDVLIVGGGGSGSMDFQSFATGGGGGGGGEVLYITAYDVSPGTYSAIIGEGGLNEGGGFGGTAYDGDPSSIFSYTANGGQKRASEDDKNGGTSGSGNLGGIGTVSGGGGGGGAGDVGSNSIGAKGGNGGDGLPYDISGTMTYYGGGGGGSAAFLGPPTFAYDTQGLGGLGGGGNGVTPDDPRPNGTPNTGGGGGAGTNGGFFGTPRNSGYGGSGVIIIRYVG